MNFRKTTSGHETGAHWHKEFYNRTEKKEIVAVLSRAAWLLLAEGEEEVTCPRTKQKVTKRKVVRGGAIRKAAAERGREINKRREVDMKVVEELLELTQPETGGQPTSSEGAERLKEEVLTWAACEKAIRRFQKGQGGRLGPTRRILAAHSNGGHSKRLLAPAGRDCRDRSVSAGME